MIATLAVLLVLASDPQLAPAEPAPSPASEADAPGPGAASTVAPTPPESLRYPLGPLAPPDERAAAGPFTLTDLSYGLDSADSETAHGFAARVRYKNRGYLAAEASGERKGLSLTTHRLGLAAYDELGRWDLAAAYRGGRFVAAAGATWRKAGDRSWVLEPSLSLRITSDLEVEAWTVADTQEPGDRLVTEWGGDLGWQHGARLALFGEFVRNYELIAVGVEGRRDENRRDTGLVAGTAQIGAAEITGRVALEDVSGRFPRRNTDASLQLRLPLRRRLLLEGGGRGRFDNGGGELLREYGAALSWHGRRITLPRAGRSAERAVALAREATRAGEYELFAFDTDALREQRLRLALSPRRDALRQEMDAVYRAEVEERLLPLLGLAYHERSDEIAGESVRSARVLVGVPWPPALPWRARESSVRFLELAYTHEWRTTAESSSTPQHSGLDQVSLTVALNRELDLVLSWSHAQPTALDIIRGRVGHDRFAASFVYARGR